LTIDEIQFLKKNEKQTTLVKQTTLWMKLIMKHMT